MPLEIGIPTLRLAASHVLELDSEGRSILQGARCNRVALSDLQLSSVDDQLRVSMAVSADTGTYLLSRCLGPPQWLGRLRVDLQPSVDENGLNVLLEPLSAELRKLDGSSGLMSQPTRLLAEHLILPRLRQLRVPLGDPLAVVADLLTSLIPNQTGLATVPHGYLKKVIVAPSGMVAELVFEVTPNDPAVDIAEPPLDRRELAQWQRLEDELDGFLTTIIERLAMQTSDRDLRLDLMGVLLDVRLGIAQALGDDAHPTADDPVRDLFVTSWDRLRPYATALLQTNANADAVVPHLASFVAGADAIAIVDALGPEYGIEITADGLRRLARILLRDETPIRFTPLPLSVDRELRSLLELQEETTTGPAHGHPTTWLQWFIPDAHAQAGSPAEELHELVPRPEIMKRYLDLVSRLLEQQVKARLNGATRVPAEHRALFEPLLRATAWKESCWRHYVGQSGRPEVIRSAIGAIGMMQINARVWRGLYDLERLVGEVQYNVTAGIEILEHYLVHYALRRGEHEHPGGVDNLVRATYAAYNGGPGHLSRYRRANTSERLRSIDRAFWQHYERIKKQRWPDVGSCYAQ